MTIFFFYVMLMQVAHATCDYDNIDAILFLLMNKNQEIFGNQEIPPIGWLWVI